MARKKDILGENSKHLINAYKEGKLVEFVKELADSGFKLKKADLSKVYRTTASGTDVSVAEAMADSALTDNAFVPEAWVGNIDTARALYEGQKDRMWLSHFDFDEFATKVAKLEGQEAKKPTTYKLEFDDRKKELLELDSSGFLSAVTRAIKVDGLPALRKKLQDAGYDFSRAEFMHLANEAYPALITHSRYPENKPIKHIDYIMEALAENGERFTIEDWKTEFTIDGHRYNVATLIAARGYLPKLFKPELWVGYTGEMQEVAGLLRAEDRKKVGFDGLLAEAQALSGPEFEIPASLSKNILFTPNDDGRAPFDDARTLRKLAEINDALGDDRLTKADFLRELPSGQTLITRLHGAGQLDTVLAHLQDNAESFTTKEIAEHGLGHLFEARNLEFWDACKDANYDRVKELIKLGVDIEFAPQGKRTALSYAATKSADLKVVKILLKAGADPTATSGDWSMIAEAGYNGKSKVVKELIKAIQDRFKEDPARQLHEFTKLDNSGDSPLSDIKDDATKEKLKSAIESAKEQLVAKAGDVDYETVLPNGDTHLHTVIRTGDLESVATAVAKIVEINGASIHGTAPDDVSGILEALTRKGRNSTPTDLAKKLGFSDIETFLNSQIFEAQYLSGDNSAFVRAAGIGNLDLVQRCVDDGVDIDFVDGSNNRTALVAAFVNGKDDVAQYLLKKGASPDRPKENRSGRDIPLHIALSQDNPETATTIINLLKNRYKSNPLDLLKALSARNRNGYSPYKIAKDKGYDEVAKLIQNSAKYAFLSVDLEKEPYDQDVKNAIKDNGLESLANLARPHKRVTIIGAGFSGTAVAIKILENADEPTEIVMVEQSDARRSGGIAYSAETTEKYHKTNIPVSTLSPFFNEKNEFPNWLDRADRSKWPEEYRDLRLDENDAIPRQLYQIFMAEKLERAEQNTDLAWINKQTGYVKDADIEGEEPKAYFSDGREIHSNVVVLATGNVKAKEAPFAKDVADNPNYVVDQYTPEGKKAIGDINAHGTVMIMGTALTGYDAALSLIKNGHKGKIIMLSRNGLEHIPFPSDGISTSRPRIDRPDFMDADTIPELIAGIRRDYWHRTRIDRTRPDTVLYSYQDYIPELLRKFPEDEMGELIQKYYTLINVTRATVDPEIAEVILEAKISGQLEVVAGNIHKMQEAGNQIGVKYTPTGASEPETARVDAVISSLGRSTNNDELWRNLEEKGAVAKHFTGSGIQVGESGEIVNARGEESSNFIAVGPMRAGDSMARKGDLGPWAAALYGIRKQLNDSVHKIRTVLSRSEKVYVEEANALPKMILSTAFTGVRYNPDRLETPEGEKIKVREQFLAENMPITPEEMAVDAEESYAAGSRYMHIHARNPQTGRQTGTPEHYRETFEKVREAVPGVMLGGPTSRREEVGDVLKKKFDALRPDEITPERVAEVEMARAEPTLGGDPDFLTLFTEPDVRNPKDLEHFRDNTRTGEARRWPETVRLYFDNLEQRMAKENVNHELEITHPSSLNTIETLVDKGALKLGGSCNKAHAVILLGFSGELPVSREAMDHAISRLTHLQNKTGIQFNISVGAVIPPKMAATKERAAGEPLEEGKHDYREVIEWVIDHNRSSVENGQLPIDIFRTGLEDTPVLYGKQQTNAGLAAHAHEIFLENGVGIEKDQDKVNKLLAEPVERLGNKDRELGGWKGFFTGRLNSARSSGSPENETQAALAS